MSRQVLQTVWWEDGVQRLERNQPADWTKEQQSGYKSRRSSAMNRSLIDPDDNQAATATGIPSPPSVAISPAPRNQYIDKVVTGNRWFSVPRLDVTVPVVNGHPTPGK